MPKSQAPRKSARSEPKPKKKNNQIMDDLMSIDKECEKMLGQTAKFSPYLVNRDLVEAGQTEKIHDNAKILARDVMSMKVELDEIRVKLPKRIHTDNPSHVMRGMEIGEAYNAWQEKYSRAILPTLERLGELFKEAAETLGKNADSDAAEIIEEVKSDDNT
jgi:hypothetical protein